MGAGFLYRFLKKGFYGLQVVFRGAIDVEDVYARTCGASSRDDFDEGVGDGLAEVVRLCRVRVMNKNGRAGLGILREGGVLWQAGVEVFVSCRAMASGGSFWVKRESW